jgi:signal peptidase I
MTGSRRARLDRLRGPWRIAVVEGSMRPAIEPGDWLLIDPTVARWPRRGTPVVFREPDTIQLAIKRVAGRPGDWIPFADGWLRLGPEEAWLIGDATDAELAAAGFGSAVDSRRYGPVPLEALVARAWFRYGPARRLGRIGAAPVDLLARGRAGRGSSPEVPVDGGRPASDTDAGRGDTLP